MAKSRFERNFDLNDLQVFYLDLITYRSISDQLAVDFKVEHQSPQLLFVQKGVCTYHASHNAIDTEAIKAKL